MNLETHAPSITPHTLARGYAQRGRDLSTLLSKQSVKNRGINGSAREDYRTQCAPIHAEIVQMRKGAKLMQSVDRQFTTLDDGKPHPRLPSQLKKLLAPVAKAPAQYPVDLVGSLQALPWPADLRCIVDQTLAHVIVPAPAPPVVATAAVAVAEVDPDVVDATTLLNKILAAMPDLSEPEKHYLTACLF